VEVGEAIVADDQFVVAGLHVGESVFAFGVGGDGIGGGGTLRVANVHSQDEAGLAERVEGDGVKDVAFEAGFLGVLGDVGGLGEEEGGGKEEEGEGASRSSAPPGLSAAASDFPRLTPWASI
jgi:hypothetical protein